MNLLEHLISIDDYASADAIHSEFIVDGLQPEDGNYIWLFVERIKEIKDTVS